MILGNNFHWLYSPWTQTINKIIFTINGHLILIDKLNKAYTRHKIEFTYSQCDEKVIPAQ